MYILKRGDKNLFIEVSNTYYRCILLHIGNFYSKIIDERHFSTKAEALAFKNTHENIDTICLCVSVNDNFCIK